MYKIAKLPDKERSELFSETASRMHTTNVIVSNFRNACMYSYAIKKELRSRCV